MNREQIIALAHKAGLCEANGEDDYSIDISLYLVRFAALVAAHEREQCAKVCDTHTVDDVLVGVGIAQSCAAAIRERSDT